MGHEFENEEFYNERLFLSGCIPVSWKSPYERMLDAKLLADSALMDQAAVLKYKFDSRKDIAMLLYLSESYSYLAEDIRKLKEQKARQKPVQMARILSQTHAKLKTIPAGSGNAARIQVLNQIIEKIQGEYPALKERFICRNKGQSAQSKPRNVYNI